MKTTLTQIMPDETTIGNNPLALYNEYLLKGTPKDDPMRIGRTRIWLTLLIVLSVTTVSARQFFQAEQCTIAADETVVGTVFVLCQNLVIDGVVDGNLFGAATNTVINGQVTDGVYLLGSQFDLYGSLGDDLHFIGAVLNIHPEATFENSIVDLFSLTMSTKLQTESELPGSIVAAGYQLLVHGDVGGEINFWGSALELDGSIGGDVIADVGDAGDTEGTAQLETLFIPFPAEIDLVNPGLRIRSSSEISGNLRYRAPARGLELGSVEGEVYFQPMISQPQIDISDEESLRRGFRQYIGTSLREFITLAVVGAVGLLFAPSLTQAPIRNLRRRPLTSLGVGTLAFILSFPVVVIAVIISVMVIFVLSLLQVGNLTIAGLVVLLLFDVGGASLFYFVAIFVARSIFCLAIGRRLVRFIFEDDGSMRFLYVGLAAGSLLVALLVSLPYIGWLLNAITLFLGLGAIINLVQAELRTIRENVGYMANGNTPLSGVRFGSRRLDIDIDLPPLPDDLSPQRKSRPRHHVGTDNLPPDFIWWDEL
jgi:cytoskeletal protein CcmA (bactofilin family)